MATLCENEMRAELARQTQAAGGIRAFARKHGLSSHASVSLALSGARPVTEELANYCGFMAVTTFRRMRDDGPTLMETVAELRAVTKARGGMSLSTEELKEMRCDG